MVAPSKLFTPALNCYHCSQFIIHPGIGCLRSFLIDLVKNYVGGLKYFSPLLITPLLLKSKSVNREFFAATVKYYLETVFWSSLATASTFFFICCFRNIIGRFLPYTTIFVPTVMGMQFCWFFPPKVMKLFSTATAQCALEGVLRQHVNPITRLLLNSTPLKTFIFMLNSAIILHSKRFKIYRDFWFMQPYEVVKTPTQGQGRAMDVNANYIHSDGSVHRCAHVNNKTCTQFVWEGLRTYMMYGIPLDLIGAIMKNEMSKDSQGVLQTAWAKLKKFRPNMTGFFIFYSGIYRMSSCLLRKYYGHLSTDLQHILAAFLGGASYMLIDKVSFVTLSTVIAVQIVWQQFCNRLDEGVRDKNKNSKRKPYLVLQLLKVLPFSRILFALNAGYLVHNFIMNYDILNSLSRGFLDALSSNKTKYIKEAITKPTLEELINTARKNPVKVFL